MDVFIIVKETNMLKNTGICSILGILLASSPSAFPRSDPKKVALATLASFLAGVEPGYPADSRAQVPWRLTGPRLYFCSEMPLTLRQRLPKDI